MQFESNNQELIVVYNEGRNKPIKLKTFYEVKGLIRWKSNSSSFAWRKDHGIITGNLAQLLNIFKNKHFKNFKIIPKGLYDYETCNTEFEKPCPYYHGALCSLIMPTSLALLAFLFLSCCTGNTQSILAIICHTVQKLSVISNKSPSTFDSCLSPSISGPK